MTIEVVPRQKDDRENMEAQIAALDRLVARLLEAGREDLCTGIHFEHQEKGPTIGRFMAKQATTDTEDEHGRNDREWIDYYLRRHKQMRPAKITQRPNSELLKIIEAAGEERAFNTHIDYKNSLFAPALAEAQRRQALDFLRNHVDTDPQ